MLGPLTLVCLIAGCGGGGSSTGGGGDGVGVGLGDSADMDCGVTLPSQTRKVNVSSLGGIDGPSCGPSTAPCLTIAKGIDTCVASGASSASGCTVLVRHGLYPTAATINLHDGVSVYGSCHFSNEPDRPYRTIINAGPAPGTPAISAEGVNSPTVFAGIVVLGKEETTGGVASIVMRVNNSTGLTLTRTVLVAGRGGDAGSPTTPPQAPTADAGSDGNALAMGPASQGRGGPSCGPGGAGDEGAGGAGSARRENTLSDIGVISAVCNASGGSSGDEGGDIGRDGFAPHRLGGEGGGAGTEGSGCFENNEVKLGLGGPGSAGGTGRTGDCSALGGQASQDIWGGFSAAGWQPGAAALSGGLGELGSGGGGGGPGGMCALHDTTNHIWIPYIGLPGAGGGAGGCSGQGGQGGGQGGASIVLLLAASTLPLPPEMVSIVGGQGGNGAHGATGGVGGQGGAGAFARNSPNCVEYNPPYSRLGGPGGNGGAGGAGGAGAGGGGGNGGPSVGIALVSNASAPGAAGVYPGSPGGGAAGGGGGTTSHAGQDDCVGGVGLYGATGGMAVMRTF
ncbi:MAG: hypothetical protein ACMG51_09890 [Ginsengibacter sp.]